MMCGRAWRTAVFAATVRRSGQPDMMGQCWGEGTRLNCTRKDRLFHASTMTHKGKQMVAPTDSKQQATVFYSWQSDLPNARNRGMIQDALERATKSIRADNSLAVEPVLARDTQNVPGAPDIAHTIFQKIERAAAFVADLTIINPGLGRPTPNPNVLIEVGYALRTLGSPRTVLVANTANGPVEALLFDLRTKRVLTYHLPPGTADKPEQRRKLQEGLEFALRAILADEVARLAAPSAVDKAIEGVKASAANQRSLCAKVIPAIAKRVEELTPKLREEESNRWDDHLVLAIQQTVPLVLDHRNRRLKLNRLSLHADILKERHESGDLRELSPWPRFLDADVFLYLRSVFEKLQVDPWTVWRPWTAAFLRGTPAFLLEATRREKAEQLLEPLAAKDLADLRRRLKDAAEQLKKIFGSRNPFFYPFANLNPDLIGTE